MHVIKCLLVVLNTDDGHYSGDVLWMLPYLPVRKA